MTARMAVQIPFPLFLSNVTFDKKTHNNICSVDYPVQSPAENSQVVSINTSYFTGRFDVKREKSDSWLLNMVWAIDLPLGIVPSLPSSPLASILTMGSSLPNSGPKISISAAKLSPSPPPFLLVLIRKSLCKRVPNTIKTNGIC